MRFLWARFSLKPSFYLWCDIELPPCFSPTQSIPSPPPPSMPSSASLRSALKPSDNLRRRCCRISLPEANLRRRRCRTSLPDSNLHHRRCQPPSIQYKPNKFGWFFVVSKNFMSVNCCLPNPCLVNMSINKEGSLTSRQFSIHLKLFYFVIRALFKLLSFNFNTFANHVCNATNLAS